MAVSKTADGGSIPSAPAKIFSLLFKIETIPSMPVELCLHNQNKIFNDGEEIDYKSISDAEVGAMNVRFSTLNNNTPDEIYAKIGETNCRIMPTEGVTLDGQFEIRNPLPVEAKVSLRGEKILVNLEQNNNVVKISEFPANFNIKWQTYVFLKNLLIFIFAWWIFLSSCISLWEFISKKYKLRT